MQLVYLDGFLYAFVISIYSLVLVESRAMEFVGSSYTAAIDEASLQTQEIVQQVVAIPSGPLSNVTYSIEPNKYVDINSLTGEVSWKGQKILLKGLLFQHLKLIY